MTTLTKHQSNALIAAEFASDVTAIGTTTVTVPVDGEYRQWTIGVEFYDDAAGTSVVDPTAATATPAAQSVALPSVFEAFGASAIDCSAGNNAVEEMVGHLTNVRVVLSAVTAGSATHWRVRAVGSQT